MSDLTEISAETLDAIKKATTAGVNSSTGLQGVDLSDVISLIPINTPFFDSLAHTSPTEGATLAQWKALVNVNETQPDPSIGFDYAGNLANIDELDVGAYFKPLAMGYTVTQDSINLAKGYADAKAIAINNALLQWKLGADRKALGGQNFALSLPGTPNLVASATGGSIAASTTVTVQVAAKTLSNYNYGGSTAATTAGSVTTASGGDTNSVVATWTESVGAVAYDVYVAGFYYTTVTTNKVTVTSVPTQNAATVPNLPGLYRTAPTAVPATDSSAKANDFNGLLASLAGDYASGGAFGLLTHGSGVSSGAKHLTLDGASFTVNGQNVSELDELFGLIYNDVQLSPDELLMSSDLASSISSAVLSNGSGYTTFAPNNVAERQDVILGGFAAYYINKAAGGTPVKISVQPNLASGTVIAKTNSVPFPNSNITNTVELRDLQPVSDYEYGTSRQAGVAGGGPRFDGETRSLTTFINRAPVAMGWISNVAVA